MRKLSTLFLLCVSFFVFTSLHSVAQKLGDECDGPLVAKLCDSGTFTIETDSFINNVSSWKNDTIHTPGPDIFYQVNLPSTPFAPKLINAVFTGHFTADSIKKTKIYFFWFESSSCATAPLKIDSFPIKSNSFEFPDSFIISYPVSNAQSSYYLAVDFKDSLNHPDSLHNLNYEVTIHFGFTNVGPNEDCDTFPKPYRGRLEIDTAICFNHSNPYNLPLVALGDSASLMNVLLPSSFPQNTPYIPINDQFRLGFNLDLKRIIADSSQKQEIYITYDRFPYLYAKHAKYVVGITMFMMNNKGTSGLKGFRMKIKHGLLVKGSALPTDSARGTYYIADTMAHWTVSYDTLASTCTWIFKDSLGRGDNVKSKYTCQPYTFSVMLDSISDTIRAWYLPDNYGHDSLGCIRTDCGFGDYGDALPQWIELLGSGSFGGGRGITGTSGCSDNFTTCSLGAKLFPCPATVYYNTCPAGMVGTSPYIQYFDDGCYETISPVTDYFYARDFADIPDSGSVYDTICPGLTAHLNISADLDIATAVIFIDSTGVSHPVDQNGNINFSVDFNSEVNHMFPNLGAIPNYPSGSFSINVGTKGQYTLRSVYEGPDGTPYIGSCFGSMFLSLLPRPHTTTTVMPDTICRGDQATITADSALSFEWLPDTTIVGNFGDVVNVAPYVTTTYYVVGKNSLGCIDTATAVVNIKVCPPEAGFVFLDSVCANYPDVSINDTSAHSPDTWIWTFEGAHPSTFNGQQLPPIKYDSAGTYKIKLVVSNTAGTDSVTELIHVKDCGPKAAFDTIVDFCATDSIVPVNESSANASSWNWSFVGGTPSSFNGKNPPPVFYSDSGVYTITLIASNIYGSDTANRTFTVNNCKPLASFLRFDSSCAPVCVQFSDMTLRNPTSWQWNFPGGNPSSYNGQVPPTVCYDSGGVYNTQLIAGNRYGSDTVTIAALLVNCPPMIIDSYVADSICAGEPVSFSDSTRYATPGKVRWEWHFYNLNGVQDSIYSNTTGDFPPPITYDTAGIYAVGFELYNVKRDSLLDSRLKYIVVKDCRPIAAFDSVANFCATDSVIFVNESKDATSWNWSMPGGTPSSYVGQYPPPVFYNTLGTYTATLIVSNIYGSDTAQHTFFVDVCTPEPVVLANNYTCAPVCITFTDTSLFHPATSWDWSFVGGNPSSFNGKNPPDVCYDSAGTYTVQLTASNRYGSNTYILNVPIDGCPPVAAFILPDSICHSDCATITDSSYHNPGTWQWTFDSGTPSSFTGENPPVVCYAVAGDYPVKLVVTNRYGSDSLTKTLHVAKCVPHAAFTGIDSICRIDCASFGNTSSNDATSWDWSFTGGNPSSYSGQNPPAVCYNTKGTYDVQLIVSNKYGADTSTQKIKVVDCSPFTSYIADDTICRTNCVPMNNPWASNLLTWQWSFPGGNPSNFNGSAPPNICYDTAGNYTARLIVSNSTAADTITTPIVVSLCNPTGSFAFGDTICKTQCVGIPQPVSHNATSWLWSFPGGNPSSYNGENPPRICYDTTGTYGITVIFSNAYGHDTVHLANCVVVTSLAGGLIANKGDTLTSPVAASYQWYLNSQPISGATKQTYVAKQNGNYSVDISNNHGCSKYISVSIDDLAVNEVDANFDLTISPNPNSGVFQVTNKYQGTGYRLQVSDVKVFNVVGEMIDAKLTAHSPQLITIDLSSQPDGIYFVKVQTTNGTVMRKVVVSR